MKNFRGKIGSLFEEVQAALIDEYVEHERVRLRKMQMDPRKIAEMDRINMAAAAKRVKKKQHCERIRRLHGLQPFTWEREDVESLRGAISGQPLPKLREFGPEWVAKQQQAQANAKKKRTDDMSLGELAATMKTKPEYSGSNHPLEFNQAHRTNRPGIRSIRGQFTLDQFNQERSNERQTTMATNQPIHEKAG